MKAGPVLYRSPTKLYEAGGSCASCYLTAEEGGHGIVAVGGHVGDSGDPIERSAGSIEAAQALLRDRTADEDEIFPTLTLASATGGRPFRLLYRGVEMVRVVDGVPILRRSPLLAYACSNERRAGGAITAVIITVTASRRAVSADDIARAYEQILEEEGMAWGGSGYRVSCLSSSGMLQLEVEELDEFGAPGDGRRWPAPATVGRHARVALDDYGESLILRKGGGSDMSSDNLILALVARVLADAVPRKGGKVNRKEVHRLLDTYILPGARWRKQLSDGADPTGERRLWDNVKKVALMEELYEPGPMRFT